MKKVEGPTLTVVTLVDRIRSGFWPEVFLVGSVIVGLEPFTVGLLVRHLSDQAWLGPGVFSLLCYACLQDLPWRQRFRWILLGAGVATAVLTAAVVLVSPLALAFMPAPGWFPWLLLWGMLPAAFARIGKRSSLVGRALSAVGVAAAAYVISGLLCFVPWTHTWPPDVEHRDEQGRQPALGPGVSWVGRVVCVPQGPSSILSRDYGGNEWLWTVYRPLVRLWFARPSARYFYPYSTMPPNW